MGIAPTIRRLGRPAVVQSLNIIPAIMLTRATIPRHHAAVRDIPIRIDVSLAEATELWLSRYSSANTRAAYGADVRGFFTWRGGAPAGLEITPEELAEYRTERASAGASPATIDRQFAALRAFYGAARELGWCDQNPFGSRPPAAAAPSETPSLTPGEVSRLREASAVEPRTDVLVHLLLGEGLRLAEVLALDHADVSGSRHAKRLRIVRHGNPAAVELDRAASQSVGALERSSPKPGPLFTGPSRGRSGPARLTRFGADHLLKQAAASAGIERPVSSNVLRRAHVATAQSAGATIDEIRRNMGHRDVRTTRRYLAPGIPNQPSPDQPPTERS